MPVRTVPLLLAVAITAVVLSACTGDGGGDEPTSTLTPVPDARTVTSDDGKLTLEIPPGAVADEVEITIKAVSIEVLPRELQGVRGAGTGYLLEPDGLEFSSPATATLTLDRADLEGEPDDGITAYALVSFREGDGLELLTEQSTEWTVGEASVMVRGQLSHFSWIGKTKGSLSVEIEKAAAQVALGGMFTVKSTATNTDASTAQVVLRATNGEFRHEQNFISVVGERRFPVSPRDLTPGEKIEGTATYSCDEEGEDFYYVRVYATSVLSGKGDEDDSETYLTVIVGSEVECTSVLEAPTSTPAPSPTPKPPLDIGCDHRIPGEESDIIVRINGLQPGETVSGTVSGDGVLGDGRFTATAGDDGTAEARVVIDSFDTYTVTLDDGGPSGTITVGPVCDDFDDDDFDDDD